MAKSLGGYIKEQEFECKLGDLLDQVTTANPGMQSICFDVASAHETRQAVDALLEKFPSLNVLINNAGIMPLDDPSSELTDSDIERVTETNFVAPIRLTYT